MGVHVENQGQSNEEDVHESNRNIQILCIWKYDRFQWDQRATGLIIEILQKYLV